MVSQETLTVLHEKYQALAPFMDERVLRRWAASEAQALGWGGASAVTQATGISRTTIRSGIAELHQSTPEPPPGRIRKPGAGRPGRVLGALNRRHRDPLTHCPDMVGQPGCHGRRPFSDPTVLA